MLRDLAPTIVALGLIFSLLPGGSATATEYEVVTFSFPAAPITGGRGLNDINCQVGYYQTDAADFATAQAIRRCDGIIETINPPDSLADRRAFGINDSGTVVGSALRASGQDGFELSGGVFSWVAYPGAGATVLRGINNLGDVVGEYDDTLGVRHAFSRIGGIFAGVDVPAAPSSRARAINDLGEIVGHYDDMSGVRHGFRRSPAGVYTTVDFAGATESLLGGINNAGDVSGTYFDGMGIPHGFVIRGSTVEPFDVPGSLGTFLTDINEAGQLVGEYVDGSGVNRGFVASPILFADGFESADLLAWSNTSP